MLVGVIVLPFAGCKVWDSVETRRFWREVDAIEARGERVEPDVPLPTTEEQRQASRLYGDALRQVANVNRATLQQLGTTIEEIAASPAPSQHAKLAELKAFGDQYAAALDAQDRAAALDANGVDPADIQRLHGYEQTLDAVNAVRVARLSFEGKGDEAAAGLRAALRLRRTIPLSLGRWYMPRTNHSLRLLLSHTRPSDARLHALIEEYVRFAQLQRPEEVLVEGRARLLAQVMPEEFGGTASSRRISPLEAVLAVAMRPVVTRRLRSVLEDYSRAIEQSRAAWPAKLEVAQAAYESARQAQPRRRRGLLARLPGPWIPGQASYSLGVTTPQMASGLVNAGASATAVAIARYRAAHGGAPATLAELVPKYLPSPALDPYSGQPLRYLHDTRGFKVYSVGRNKVDDGGVWEIAPDLHPFRRGEPKDVGIAVVYTDTRSPASADVRMPR
jgi:hypothetical protein